MDYEIECPFCRYTNEVPVEWLKKNGRVFCPTCCKAFDIAIKEEHNEKKKDEESEIYDSGVVNTDGDYW